MLRGVLLKSSGKTVTAILRSPSFWVRTIRPDDRPTDEGKSKNPVFVYSWAHAVVRGWEIRRTFIIWRHFNHFSVGYIRYYKEAS
jgi:hypothetical protein